MNTFIINCKSVISQKGLKQKYVANQMGIPERKLSDMLNERKKIELEDIGLLCKVLETTPNELFGYK